MNLEKFKNKNILITGAGSGIGEAIACQLSETATNLFLTGRNMERLTAVRDKCNASSNRCSAHIFNVDFSDTASIDRFISDLAKQNLTFDYILLNAGISQRAPALATAFVVDRQVMETNYFGPIYLTKSLLGLTPPPLPDSTHISHSTHTSHSTSLPGGDCRNRHQPGKPIHIVVTSSISGLFGFPLRSAYCASKHALFGFFESLELENDHIKVTFLIPGRINTPISKSALLGDGSPYSKMDSGQAAGMDVNKCARIALRAISKEKHRKLIGGKELLMVYIKKFIPSLFYKLARKISAT